MSKMWLIAKHEYLTNVKRKAFLLPAFGVPIFVVVIMAVVFALSSTQADPASVGQVGYVDKSGVLSQAVNQPDYFVAYVDEASARQALDDGTLGAYFVLPEQYMLHGVVELYSISGTPDSLQGVISDFLLANLAEQINSDVSVQRLEKPVNLDIYIQDSARYLTEAAIPSLFLTPLIFVMVFMMSTQMTSGFLMSGIVEEKTSRIMEILITSITPLQLLAGKIIGLGALGLTQLLAWVAVGGAVVLLGQDISFLAGVSFPLDMVLISLVYFLLSYGLVAAIMAGIGAIVGSEQESRQYAGFISLLYVIPFFVFVTFITDPNGTVPTILSMIPLTAPIAMILRMSFGAVPAIQFVLSIAILILTTLFVVWASAKIFRWGLLMYGKRLSLREIWRVVRGKSSQIATVVASRSGEEA